MHFSPNFARLRGVALACWVAGAWFVVQSSVLLMYRAAPMAFCLGVLLLASLLLAIGVAFWPLSKDRRAGIMVDSKGLLLNLSHYAAFISWENIDHVGITTRRWDVLALGSTAQLGVRLHAVEPYIQSYEERMPAASGVIGGSLRLLAQLLRPLHRPNDEAIAAQLAANRARTGYDVLIPQAFLNSPPAEVAHLIEQRRNNGWLQRTV